MAEIESAPPVAPSRRRWRTWQALALAFVAMMIGVGIGGAASEDEPAVRAAVASDVDEPTATTAPRETDVDDAPATTVKPTTTTAKPTTTTMQKPVEVGTRSNPLPVGQTAVLSGEDGDEWQIKVVGFNPDGTADVLGANMFNEPPAPGRQFAMVRLEATYVGAEEPQTLLWGATFQMLDAANVTYDSDDDCGVVPDPIDEYGDVYKGGVIAGWKCWAVTSEHIGSLVLVVEPTFSFNSEPYFMAVR